MLAAGLAYAKSAADARDKHDLVTERSELERQNEALTEERAEVGLRACR